MFYLIYYHLTIKLKLVIQPYHTNENWLIIKSGTQLIVYLYRVTVYLYMFLSTAVDDGTKYQYVNAYLINWFHFGSNFEILEKKNHK